MLDIEFRGVNRVANALRRMASNMPDIVDKAMGPWSKRAALTLKSTPYPRKRPGQRYVRTGRLASSWGSRRNKPGVWLVKNSAPYSVYVVGKGRQAWMHVGRWWVAQDELGKITVDLTREVAKELRQAWVTG